MALFCKRAAGGMWVVWLASFGAGRAQRRPGAVEAVELRNKVVASVKDLDGIPRPDPERVEA